jgi:hypothetical protein
VLVRRMTLRYRVLLFIGYRIHPGAVLDTHSQTVFGRPNPDVRRVIAPWLAFAAALSPELLLRFQH